MVSQTDTQKVLQELIEPMKRHWSVEFDSETIADFVDDFAGFPAETLRRAMSEIRRTQKRKPTEAHLMEVCERINPRPDQAQLARKNSTSFHCTGHAEIYHPGTARKILESEAGKMALELGVSHQLLVEYEKNGRTGFDEEFVRKSHDAWMQAAGDLSAIEEKENPFYLALEGLFMAMENRERRLYGKYSYGLSH